jgi:hypothetical protein
MSTTTKKTRPLNLKSRDVREKLAKKRIKEFENEISVLEKYQKEFPLLRRGLDSFQSRELYNFESLMWKLIKNTSSKVVRYYGVLHSYPSITPFKPFTILSEMYYRVRLEGKEIRRLKLVEAKRQEIRDLIAAVIFRDYNYRAVEMRRNGDIYIEIQRIIGSIGTILIEKNDILKPVPKCLIGTLDTKGHLITHNTIWGIDNAIVQVKKITETAFQS